MATVGGFWRTYVCTSPAAVGRPDQEYVGQITLPASALEKLFNAAPAIDWGEFRRNNNRGMLNGSNQGGAGAGPMTFEISTNGGRRSFCGVAEFTAEEGSAVVPEWMAKNLGLQLGEEVRSRKAIILIDC